jgi:hypothetical protein
MHMRLDDEENNNEKAHVEREDPLFFDCIVVHIVNASAPSSHTQIDRIKQILTAVNDDDDDQLDCHIVCYRDFFVFHNCRSVIFQITRTLSYYRSLAIYYCLFCFLL